jgi:hypothetical protein
MTIYRSRDISALASYVPEKKKKKKKKELGKPE